MKVYQKYFKEYFDFDFAYIKKLEFEDLEKTNNCK